MAKLTVVLETKFKTDPLRVRDKKTFKEVTLGAAEAAKFFAKVPKEELEFDIVSTNEDAEASFPYQAKHGKKGAVLHISPPDDEGRLAVEITGEFTVDLRAGVSGMLKPLGKQLDLRLRGVMWKGGAYNGFMAPVQGGDYDQDSEKWADTFPTVSSFLLK